MNMPAYRPGQRVTAIPLQVELLPQGGIRLSSPHARGWAAVAHTQLDLARSLADAFTEVSVASYARWKNEPYDLDQLTGTVPGDALAGAPQRRIRGPRTVRKRAHAPTAWTCMEDGRWRSPSGRIYRPDSTAVRNVVRKLGDQSPG